MNVAQSCLTLCDPWTAQSMGFSRPEYWSGWLFPSHRGQSKNQNRQPVFRLYAASQGFPGGASGKEPTCQCRRLKLPPKTSAPEWQYATSAYVPLAQSGHMIKPDTTLWEAPQVTWQWAGLYSFQGREEIACHPPSTQRERVLSLGISLSCT